MRRILAVITILIILGSLPSCRLLYPNQVFKQKDYQYFDMVQKQMSQYIIQPGDEFTMRVFARDGFKLIDVFGGESVGSVAESGSAVGTLVKTYTYIVDNEGVVKLPVLGYLYVKGFTKTELERVLAEKYSGLFVDPWVSVKVTNRRVFVFKGGAASVVSLEDYPISLIEVLARTGGLDNDSKAYNIRVVRGDIKNPEVYLVDLSTIEGIRKADLSVQPNDIVVVQKRKRVVSDVLKEAAPYFGAVTTITTFVLLFKTLGK